MTSFTETVQIKTIDNHTKSSRILVIGLESEILDNINNGKEILRTAFSL
jgi:hypothetical protein